MLRKVLGFCVMAVLGGGAGLAMVPYQDSVPGGYAKADVKDEEVVRAAKFALKEQAKKEKAGAYKLEQVVSAQRQVVAGLNYKMELQVLHKGKSQRVLTVVWKKLDGKFALTEWKAKEAGVGEGAPSK